jgi:hypothetical protein
MADDEQLWLSSESEEEDLVYYPGHGWRERLPPGWGNDGWWYGGLPYPYQRWRPVRHQRFDHYWGHYISDSDESLDEGFSETARQENPRPVLRRDDPTTPTNDSSKQFIFQRFDGRSLPIIADSDLTGSQSNVIQDPYNFDAVVYDPSVNTQSYFGINYRYVQSLNVYQDWTWVIGVPLFVPRERLNPPEGIVDDFSSYTWTNKVFVNSDLNYNLPTTGPIPTSKYGGQISWSQGVNGVWWELSITYDRSSPLFDYIPQGVEDPGTGLYLDVITVPLVRPAGDPGNSYFRVVFAELLVTLGTSTIWSLAPNVITKRDITVPDSQHLIETSIPNEISLSWNFNQRERDGRYKLPLLAAGEIFPRTLWGIGSFGTYIEDENVPEVSRDQVFGSDTFTEITFTGSVAGVGLVGGRINTLLESDFEDQNPDINIICGINGNSTARFVSQWTVVPQFVSPN